MVWVSLSWLDSDTMQCFYVSLFILLFIGIFFAPMLTGSLSLESEWWQVSSSLQAPSRCSGRSRQCYCVDGRKLSYYFTDLRVFHTSISRWFSTGVWVTASLLKSPQVSRTLLSILADLNNAVIWIVSTPLLISMSTSSLPIFW